MEKFDAAQVLLWSLTYVLICIYMFRYRKRRAVGIPYIACCFNFGWELNALFGQGGRWEHILWTGLDAVIFCLNYRTIKDKKKRVAYLACFAAGAICLYYIFNIPGGMLISSFVADITMAAAFVLQRKQIDKNGKVFIATTKLLGDIFAWLAYMDETIFILIIGLLVFFLNAGYLAYSILEYKNKLPPPKKKPVKQKKKTDSPTIPKQKKKKKKSNT